MATSKSSPGRRPKRRADRPTTDVQQAEDALEERRARTEPPRLGAERALLDVEVLPKGVVPDDAVVEEEPTREGRPAQARARRRGAEDESEDEDEADALALAEVEPATDDELDSIAREVAV